MAVDKEKEKARRRAWRERNRERVAATDKAYRERNRERIAATKKIYNQLNREREAARKKSWRERNCEQKAEYDKAYRERNREREAARKKAWYERNCQRIAAIHKAWKERNPELVQENRRRRRAKKKNAQVALTAKEKEKLLVLERTRQELQMKTGREYHIDHILPINHGGLHHPVNLRILEGKENLSKNDKLLPEAIALAPEHFRLYNDRVSPERAWEFVSQLAEGLGLNQDDLDALISGKPLKRKPTLEDFMA